MRRKRNRPRADPDHYGLKQYILRYTVEWENGQDRRIDGEADGGLTALARERSDEKSWSRENEVSIS